MILVWAMRTSTTSNPAELMLSFRKGHLAMVFLRRCPTSGPGSKGCHGWVRLVPGGPMMRGHYDWATATKVLNFFEYGTSVAALAVVLFEMTDLLEFLVQNLTRERDMSSLMEQ